jgi:glutathione peroxidase
MASVTRDLIARGGAAVHRLTCVALGLLVLAGGVARADETPRARARTPGVLSFKMKSLDGKDVDLSQYQGKVVLFVNVASKCGYTPQYKGLQALHDKYSKDGLVIIGVPANEFKKQEPGTNEEIAEFCSKNYGVKFPMMAKVVVKGDGICPLYRYLTSKESNPRFGGDIRWNFTKFLVNRKGEIVNRFEPKIEPESDEMTGAIEKELEQR